MSDRVQSRGFSFGPGAAMQHREMLMTLIVALRRAVFGPVAVCNSSASVGNRDLLSMFSSRRSASPPSSNKYDTANCSGLRTELLEGKFLLRRARSWPPVFLFSLYGLVVVTVGCTIARMTPPSAEQSPEVRRSLPRVLILTPGQPHAFHRGSYPFALVAICCGTSCLSSHFQCSERIK
jgi:hypothetical protein